MLPACRQAYLGMSCTAAWARRGVQSRYRMLGVAPRSPISIGWVGPGRRQNTADDDGALDYLAPPLAGKTHTLPAVFS